MSHDLDQRAHAQALRALRQAQSMAQLCNAALIVFLAACVGGGAGRVCDHIA